MAVVFDPLTGQLIDVPSTGGGVNSDLSNVTEPTAIPVGLTFANTGDDKTIITADNPTGDSDDLEVETGDALEEAGNISIHPGTSGPGFDGAPVRIRGGNSEDSLGGSLELSGGSNQTTGEVSSVNVRTPLFNLYGGEGAISGGVKFQEASEINHIDVRAPTTVTSTYNIILPDSQGLSGTTLVNDGSGNLSWSPSGALSSDVHFGSESVGGIITADSTGMGALAHGSADNDGVVESVGAGSTAAGSASDSGSLLSAAAIGSHATGTVSQSGQIVSSGSGTLASGYSDGAGSLINASNNGSISTGQVQGGGKIVANENGALAIGQANDTAEINATAPGTVARGLASDADSRIRATGIASTATGNAIAGGSIIASGQASFAVGDASDTTSTIESLGLGSFASGAVNTAGIIITNSDASVAHGFAIDTGAIQTTVGSEGSLSGGVASGNNSLIQTQGQGSIAHGVASNGGQISTSSPAAFAFGQAEGPYQINAAASGAVALGYSVVGSVSAAGTASLSSGDDLNNFGNNAQMFGVGHQGAIPESMAIGIYSTSGGSPVGDGSDYVFKVGNGTDSGNRSDALRVDKDGRLTTTASKISQIRIISGDTTLSGRTDHTLIVDSTTPGSVQLPIAEDGLEYTFGYATGGAEDYLISADPGDTIDGATPSVGPTGNQTVSLKALGGVWYCTAISGSGGGSSVPSAAYGRGGFKVVGSGTYVKVDNYFAALVDTDSALDITTGDYTVPFTGLYQISGSGAFTGVAVSSQTAMDLYINGVSYSTIASSFDAAGSGPSLSGVPAFAQLNAGDVVSLYVFQNSGLNRNFTAASISITKL